MGIGVLQLGRIDAPSIEMVVEALGINGIKDSRQSAENTNKHTGAEPRLHPPSQVGE